MVISAALARAVRRSPALVRSASSAASAISTGSNPALSFPCVDQHQSRVERIKKSKQPAAPVNNNDASDGPEPVYGNVSGYKTFHHPDPVKLDYGGVLRQFDVAYETWGKLNADRSNAILIHTGLSASSHARSSPDNPVPGWWEKFIGPGKAIDTDQFFVICTNVLGGCYGSTGPSSRDPSDGKHYATRFPILSIFDMVRAQFKLLDHLDIKRLYASVGSSMGGMQSLAAAHLEPERVGKVVSISGTARTSPASIALRYAQRSGMSASLRTAWTSESI
jgi:homoserine acetyltransferase